MSVGIKECSRMYVERFGGTLVAAEQNIKNVLDVIEEAIECKGGVQFIDRFSLTAVSRKAKIGCNPVTREKYEIPAHTGVKVQLGKAFKKRLNS